MSVNTCSWWLDLGGAAQNAVALKGVTIGARAIIGANSVVTKDVLVGAIVVGSAAGIVVSLGVRETESVTPSCGIQLILTAGKELRT